MNIRINIRRGGWGGTWKNRLPLCGNGIIKTTMVKGKEGCWSTPDNTKQKTKSAEKKKCQREDLGGKTRTEAKIEGNHENKQPGGGGSDHDTQLLNKGSQCIADVTNGRRRGGEVQ